MSLVLEAEVSKIRTPFLILIVAQAAHSIEEYVFRLFDVLAPARFVSGLVSSDLASGFAIVNAALVLFGLWCYVAWVRTGRPAARPLAWFWALLELANGTGHSLLAISAGGYFPGVGTAPLLLGASLYLVFRLSATTPAPSPPAGRVGCLAAAMLSLLVTSFAEERPAVEVALDEARRNAANPSGQAFEATVGKTFGASYGPRLSACAKGVKKPDLRDFEVLLKLSVNGRIEEALVRPETNLALCLRDGLKDGSLPAPATSAYWVRVGLKLRR